MIEKLENQKIVLQKLISEKEQEMRDLSRRVSEVQVEIIESRGELKAINKIIEELKKDV